MTYQPKYAAYETGKTEITQVDHPWRASVRTFLQAFIPSAGLLLIVLPQILDAIVEETAAAGLVLPPEAYAWLTGASVVIATIAAIIARISAIPGVERLLEVYLPGLAAKPSQSRTEPPEGIVDDYSGYGWNQLDKDPL